MPTNVAKLGITVDANGAVTEVNRFNQALDKTVQASERVTNTTKLQDQELRKLAEISRSMGDYYGKQFQSLVQLNGGMERFLQIQRQIDEEMKAADQLVQQYASSTNKAADAATRKGVSINSLRSPLSTLAANLTGLNPQIAQLTGLLGGLALGSGVIVGVLGGLGAMSFAYDKLTEDTRKAREEQDKFVESLANARKEALAGTPEGRALTVDQAQKAYNDRLKDLANAKQDASNRAFNPEDAGSIGLSADPAAQEKRVEEATLAVRQAFIALQAAQADQSRAHYAAEQVSQQIVQNGIDMRKRWAAEDKKANDEAIRQLEERIRLTNTLLNLSSLPSAVATIDARNVVPQITPESIFGTGYGSNRQRPDEDRDRAALNAGKQIVATDQVNVDHFNNSFKDASKEVSGLEKAARTAGQALEYYLVSKVGGGGVGASLGAAVGKGALEDYAGGFAKTALGSAVFGPIAAGFGAAVGGMVDKMDIFGTHAAEAAAKLTALKKAADESARSYVTSSLGTSYEQQKLDAQTAYYSKRDELEKAKDAYSPEEFKKLLDDLYKSLQANYERINKAEQEAKRYANEDLDVRTLRAQGKDKEADAKDLANRQQAEYAKAVADKMGDEYLKRLLLVQGMEKAKAALDDFTKSAVNAVQGYRYQATIYQNSPSRTFGTGIDDNIYRPPITPVPYPSTTSASVQSGTSSGNVADVYLDGEKVGTVVLKGFQRKSQRKFGTTERWSEIQ